MLGSRVLLAALLLGSVACGARVAVIDDSAPADEATGTAQPQPTVVCGTSNVVTGQRIWGLQLAVSSGQVFYTTYGEGADGHHHGLWSVPAPGGQPSLVWMGASGILGSGLQILDGQAYFSGQLVWGLGREGVVAARLSGGTHQKIVARFDTPCAAYGGMVADDTSIYAAQSGCPAATGQILSIPRAGGPPTSLWSGDQAGDGASSIAVHGTNLYFLRDDDGDGDGAVMRLSTTGGSVATEVDAIDEAHGLAVDDDGLYVTAHDQLVAIPFDGSPPKILAAGLNHPGLVAVDATGVYVATGNVEDGAVGQVLRIAHGGGKPVVLASRQPAIFALTLDEVAVYWASQTGQLVARAGKCLP